jgi:thiol:disulfide interchange protein DsbA
MRLYNTMEQRILSPQSMVPFMPIARHRLYQLLCFFILLSASTASSVAEERQTVSIDTFLGLPQWQDKKISRPPLAIAKARSVPYSATHDNTESEDDLNFVEGKNYRRISFDTLKNPLIQQFVLKDPGKIQVIEFFNYGCFWCGRLNRPMMEWEAQKPSSVAYYRYPLVFNKHWEVLARVYYTIRKLGQSEALDSEIFEAIHQNHINLADNRELLPFMESHGIPSDKFMQIYSSNAITRQVKQGNDLSLAYRIAESPVVIINTKSGSFMCSVPEVGSEARFTQLLNQLIKSPPQEKEEI